jgi:hypothetical protein
VVVEHALIQALAALDPVPLSVVHWMVTGTWPATTPNPPLDVSFPGWAGFA